MGFVSAVIPFSFGVFVAVRRPYGCLYNNIRAVCNEVVLGIVLCLYGYCRVGEDSEQSVIAYVVVGLLYVCVLYNVTLMLKYHFCDQKKQQQVKQENN